MKLRSHILIITAATLLPLLAFVCIALVLHFESGRATQLQNLVATARALSLALDKDFEVRVAALKTLAQSAHLRNDDLKLFHEESMRVLPVLEGADAIVLVDATGQQAATTRRPFGEPLPQYSDPGFIKKVIESRRPSVSNLFISHVVQRPVISVGVPVVVDGKAKYALTMSLSPAFIQRLLEQQGIPAPWLATIIDADKIIVARTRDKDKLLGKPASPSLTANSAENAEGWWIGKPFGSQPSYVAHRRSNVSGWTVAIAVPRSTVNRPLWQALGLIVGGIIFFLLVAAGIATIFWQRIVSSITALSKAATALRKGGTPKIEAMPIVELDQVKKELESLSSEWTNAADQLDYQRQLFQKITDNITESIFITDANGRVTFVNPQAIRTFGFSAEELSGQLLHETIHSLPENEWALTGSCADDKMTRNHEDVFRNKNGTALIVQWTHAPLEVGGQHIGTILVARDISERKRLLAELEKQLAQPAEGD